MLATAETTTNANHMQQEEFCEWRERERERERERDIGQEAEYEFEFVVCVLYVVCCTQSIRRSENGQLTRET